MSYIVNMFQVIYQTSPTILSLLMIFIPVLKIKKIRLQCRNNITKRTEPSLSKMFNPFLCTYKFFTLNALITFKIASIITPTSTKMLLETSEIIAAVGYDRQSKFTSAFKSTYQMTPREYRQIMGRVLYQRIFILTYFYIYCIIITDTRCLSLKILSAHRKRLTNVWFEIIKIFLFSIL